MGRGRKGVLKQSNKAKATGGLRGRRGDPTSIFFYLGQNRKMKKYLYRKTLLNF